MMGRSPQCYIPSFVEIGPLVPEKNFEGVSPYMGVAAIMSSDFHFLVPESFHTKKNIIMSSFKSSRDIQKKEGGPDSCFG